MFNLILFASDTGMMLSFRQKDLLAQFFFIRIRSIGEPMEVSANLRDVARLLRYGAS